MATIDPLFTKRLVELAGQAKANATAAIAGGTSVHMVPVDGPGLLEIAATTKLFDRSKIGAEYEAVVGSVAAGGSAGDAISLTIQSDYLAVMERAYRAQHASPIRLFGMTYARLRGHGHDAGVFTGDVLSHVQDLIKRGQST